VRDQVLHPYNTTGKTIVLYPLICKFYTGDRGGKRHLNIISLLSHRSWNWPNM